MKSSQTGPAILLTSIIVGSCGAPPPTAPADDAPARLQALLDRSAGTEGVRSVALLVDHPAAHVRFSGASGIADPETGRRMTSQDRFRTASVTKMLTASLVLKLVDEGRLDLDASLERYFPRDTLLPLHVFEGHAYGPELTIRQLLGHTTGLADYFFDGDSDGDGTSDFIGMMLADPQRQWQPLELVRYTAEHLPPRFAPGHGFHYSDTNYVILGLLVETVTGRPLHDVYREKILAPLGMVDTYLEWHEPGTPWPPLSHVFMGARDITRVNTSADWGGGGLVSTTEDLRRFLEAFFAGRVVSHASRDAMLRWSDQSGGRYGLGLIRENVAGATFVGHSGYYGVLMLYWPEQRAIVCATVNQSAVDTKLFLAEVVRILDGR